MAIAAVIWDFGGVVTTSPFEAFNRYEAERGLPRNFLRAVNAADAQTNAWARFERAEIDVETFDALFYDESARLGFGVRGGEVLGLLSGDIRPRVISAIKACKAIAKVGCITNNVPYGDGAGMAGTAEKARAVKDVLALFDHVIESSKIGIRKPDRRIYALMCEALGVEPSECIFIDDLGVNLKPAREMGMRTIKAIEERQFLGELAEATGIELLTP
jgi:putative hydrolase of the HAD superfamily